MKRLDNYFNPPHGDKPPSDEAVRAATERYVDQERRGELSKDKMPAIRPTNR